MFCSNCGKKVIDNAKFCDNCGMALDEQAATTHTNTARELQQDTGSSSSTSSQSADAIPVTPSQQPANRPAAVSNTSPSTGEPPLSVGSYIGMMVITAIPIVGLIMLLVWAFSGNDNRNRKNWARATLILGIIVIVLMILSSSILAAMLSSMFQGAFNELLVMGLSAMP